MSDVAAPITSRTEVWLDPVAIVTPLALCLPDLPPYPLDALTCVVELEDGGEVTAYRLRWPKREGDGDDEYLIYARMRDRDGKAAADGWLWDQLALEVQRGDESAWSPLTAQMKQHTPDSHKRQAIYARYLCRAVVLAEKSEVSFDGGSWCVELAIGPPGGLVGVVECMVSEWDDEQRDEYRRAGAGLAARLQAAEQIFDSIFQSCAGGTVDDLPFAIERQGKFLRWLEPPFKLVLIEALAAVWDAPLSVCVHYE